MCTKHEKFDFYFCLYYEENGKKMKKEKKKEKEKKKKKRKKERKKERKEQEQNILFIFCKDFSLVAK